jgi:hypothetical protein
MPTAETGCVAPGSSARLAACSTARLPPPPPLLGLQQLHDALNSETQPDGPQRVRLLRVLRNAPSITAGSRMQHVACALC